MFQSSDCWSATLHSAELRSTVHFTETSFTTIVICIKHEIYCIYILKYKIAQLYKLLSCAPQTISLKYRYHLYFVCLTAYRIIIFEQTDWRLNLGDALSKYQKSYNIEGLELTDTSTQNMQVVSNQINYSFNLWLNLLYNFQYSFEDFVSYFDHLFFLLL